MINLYLIIHLSPSFVGIICLENTLRLLVEQICMISTLIGNSSSIAAPLPSFITVLCPEGKFYMLDNQFMDLNAISLLYGSKTVNGSRMAVDN